MPLRCSFLTKLHYDNAFPTIQCGRPVCFSPMCEGPVPYLCNFITFLFWKSTTDQQLMSHRLVWSMATTMRNTAFQECEPSPLGNSQTFAGVSLGASLWGIHKNSLGFSTSFGTQALCNAMDRFHSEAGRIEKQRNKENLIGIASVTT